MRRELSAPRAEQGVSPLEPTRQLHNEQFIESNPGLYLLSEAARLDAEVRAIRATLPRPGRVGRAGLGAGMKREDMAADAQRQAAEDTSKVRLIEDKEQLAKLLREMSHEVGQGNKTRALGYLPTNVQQKASYLQQRSREKETAPLEVKTGHDNLKALVEATQVVLDDVKAASRATANLDDALQSLQKALADDPYAKLLQAEVEAQKDVERAKRALDKLEGKA